MIQVTRWRPDTCACVVNVLWDDKEAPEARNHEFSFSTVCIEHTAVTAAAVVAENRLKNTAVGVLVDAVVGITAEDITYRFDGAQRVLTVSVRGLARDKTQTLLDTALGQGKVTAGDG